MKNVEYIWKEQFCWNIYKFS